MIEKEYGRFVRTTLIPADEETTLLMCSTKLIGEIGELAELIAKYYFHGKGTPFPLDKVVLELGDICYYTFTLANCAGESLSNECSGAKKEYQFFYENCQRLKGRDDFLSLIFEMNKQANGISVLLAQNFLHGDALRNDHRDYILGMRTGQLYACLKGFCQGINVWVDKKANLTLEMVLERNAEKLKARHAKGFQPNYQSDSVLG